ncbi:MAG: complex I NDUFA9 subunit family protein [Pseudomonadota bacterium]
MKKRTICILGGTGFVGSHLINELAKQGHRVRVLARRPERARHLLVYPNVAVVEANIHDGQQLKNQFSGCDTVINLVGILNESGKGGFQHVHAELPRKVVNACREAGVRRLLHMSALHADAQNGPSEYLRSKGAGEAAVLGAQDLDVTVFCPSVIYGQGDSFFNRFASLLRLSPLVMPLAGSYARFAPIYVGDVVQCYVRALDNKATFGQRYDLCGPKTYTLKELVAYTAQQIGVCRKVIPLGPGMSSFMASVLGILPGKLLTKDNVRSMSVDSVCNGDFPAVFDLHPTSLEAVVPRYLGSKERQKMYQSFRRNAGRD